MHLAVAPSDPRANERRRKPKNYAIISNIQDIKMLPCESGDANRVEHHGGIGEIRDVSERIGKTVPGKLPVVLNRMAGYFCCGECPS